MVAETTYDSAANIQHRYGLKILQVFHDTPRWAVALPGATGRFPSDLRHVYHFAKAMSQRFQGRVQAWEPWNEANVTTFGGHTIDELCSYQKAAYLGFKAGDSGRHRLLECHHRRPDRASNGRRPLERDLELL